MTAPGTTDPDNDLRTPSAEDGVAGDVRIPDTPETDSAAEEEDDDESEPSSGARLTREELESKYRNDPRFTMLFERHNQAPINEKGEKPKKRKTLRVGNIRLTPKRIIILLGFLLIVLACIGACFFFLVKDLDRSIECARAIALYESGDFDTAKDKLIRVLSRDPHKEQAIAALADIYHHYGDWGNETFFRQRLVRLNPLNRQYFNDYLDSAMRARNYNVIYSLLNLKALEGETLDQDTESLYLISALHSGHVSNGKSFFRSKTLGDPGYFSHNDRGRFAEVMLKAELLTPKDADKLFAELDDIKDPIVRFELLNMRAYLLSKFSGETNEARIEEFLEESAKLNNFAGAPILANYYFSRYRFDDAIRVSGEFLKDKLNAVLPILYCESCLLSGQPELIAPMAARIQSLEGRQSKIIASYLKALVSFAAGDLAETKANLVAAGNTIETPLSMLMELLIAINNRSTAEVRAVLTRFMNRPPFMDFQERARTAALQFLLSELGDIKGVPDPDRIAEYAAIAEQIQSRGDDNSFLQRIILLDRFNRNVLNEEDLQSMLDKFRGDQVLLQIAAEYYLFRQKPQQAMGYINQYRSGSDENDTPDRMTVLHMLTLDQLGRTDEAEAEFRSIVERDPDNGDLLYFYYDYCSQHGFVDSLRELAKRVASVPQDSSLREFLPFIQAEIKLADGDEKGALDLFESAKTARPDLIYHAGDFLAAGGRTDAAIKRYLSVQENAPDKVQLHLKLSKLYREKGDKENAMSQARSAWREDRDDVEARFAYAQFLVDARDYAEAINVLKFPQYKASFPEDVAELWAKAMREQIKIDYAGGRLTPAFESAKHLQIYFPDDEMAQQYIQLIEQKRQEEKESEDAARSSRNKKKSAS